MGLFSKLNMKYILLIIITFCIIAYMYLINESFQGTPPPQIATPCAKGFWCPASAAGSKEHKCPGGTYGASTNLTSPACSGLCKAGCSCPEGSTSECETPCPAGFFCVKGTGGTTAEPIICPQGYYCPLSSPAPIICPEGIFCAPGTSSIA
jgi:hypothetical protein